MSIRSLGHDSYRHSLVSQIQMCQAIFNFSSQGKEWTELFMGSSLGLCQVGTARMQAAQSTRMR